MENNLKRLIKNSTITAVAILVYGVVISSKPIYAMVIGALISIGTLFMLIRDAEASIYTGNAYKITGLGYAKRYLIYGLFLFILIKYFGKPYFVVGALGLLNVKFNILIIALMGYVEKFKRKLNN